MKSRLLMALALLMLPAFAWADSTDPQMDPNDCTGSFSLKTLNGQLALYDVNNYVAESFTALDVNNLGNSQPSSCVANNTGGTLTSLVVTVPDIPTDAYSCPTGSTGCNVSVDPVDGIVTFSFTGLNIGAGQEFGFITTGFDPTDVFKINGVTNDTAMFNLSTPEPGTFALLGTGVFSLLGVLRRRKK